MQCSAGVTLNILKLKSSFLRPFPYNFVQSSDSLVANLQVLGTILPWIETKGKIKGLQVPPHFFNSVWILPKLRKSKILCWLHCSDGFTVPYNYKPLPGLSFALAQQCIQLHSANQPKYQTENWIETIPDLEMILLKYCCCCNGCGESCVVSGKRAGCALLL